METPAEVFVQRPGRACFVCYKPQSLESQAVEVPEGCPATPAIADILSFANGLALRSVVAEILKVPMAEYNCRVYLLLRYRRQEICRQANELSGLCRTSEG